jgi:hypothetical protein
VVSHLLASIPGQGAAQLLGQFAHLFTERGYYGHRVLAGDFEKLLTKDEARRIAANIGCPLFVFVSGRRRAKCLRVQISAQTVDLQVPDERPYFVGVKIYVRRSSRVHRFPRSPPTRQTTKPAHEKVAPRALWRFVDAYS